MAPAMKPPAWWTEDLNKSRNVLVRSTLRAAGNAYGSAAKLREQMVDAYQCSKPVICIGNFTVGGAGKTPLAINVADRLSARGKSIAFLTRGYGGTVEGPHMVDPGTDTAEAIGDEAFLLAQHGPVMISADRAAGARILELVDCDVIIMDDGFQNPTLRKDLSIIVADASVDQPFGNLEVMPAGPLRAPIDWQSKHADAILVVSDEPKDVQRIREDLNFECPMFRATIKTKPVPLTMQHDAIIAFCGIGKPEKFFQTLADLELNVTAHIAFDDHHPFSDEEAAELVERSQQTGAKLLTTTKDATRIRNASNPSPMMKKLADRLSELEIELRVIEEDESRFDALIERAITAD